MHKRIIPLLTAGALAISSLIVSTISAQAENPAAPATPAVQASNSSTLEAQVQYAGIIAADEDVSTVTIIGKVSPTGIPGTRIQIDYNSSSAFRTPLDDGTYSVDVPSGSNVRIFASAPGYMYSWVGSDSPTASAYPSSYEEVTKTAPQSGTWDVGTMFLQKAGSISGYVRLPAEYTFGNNNSAAVFAYEVSSDGRVATSGAASVRIASDGSYILNTLKAGTQYQITVQPGGLIINPSNDFLTTTLDHFVTATENGLPETDIALKTGATISGTVTAPPGSLNSLRVNVSLCKVTGTNAGGCITQNIPVGPDGGTYSIAATPGDTVVVFASATGYLTTYVGENASYSTSSYDVSDSKIAKIQTDPNGGRVENQNIELQKAASVSGSIVLPEGYSFKNFYSGSVSIYPIDTSSGDLGARLTPSYVNDPDWVPGRVSYSSTNLVPGKQYLIMADPLSFNLTNPDQTADLLITTAGGYASSSMNASDLLNNLDDLGLITANGDITNVDIHMKQIDVTVTYNSQGTDVDTSTVEKGSTVPTLPDPSPREGYAFEGWYTEENGEGTQFLAGESPVTEDITVYAKWIATHTVTFMDGVNTDTPLATVKVNDGTAAQAPKPTRAGYTFSGWDKPIDNVTTDLTVTAQWTRITHTVKFMDDVSADPLKTETVDDGGAATPPKDPTRAGYTFAGWDTGYSNVTTDLTVTAKWTRITHTVKFMDDVSADPLKTETVDDGGAATPPKDPTRAGYTFAGWDTGYSNVTTDLTVTAKWTKNEPTTKPSPTITKEPSVTTSTEPTPTITKEPSVTTSTKASPTTTKEPSVTTSTEPSVTTSTKASPTTTKEPSVTTSTEPSVTTSTKPSPTTTKEPSVTTSTEPSVTTSTQPSPTTTKEPSVTTSTEPSVTTSTEPSPTTTKEQTPETFTVTFKDGQGNVIATVSDVPENGAVTAPADPTRDGYTFAGWDTAFNQVTRDLTVTAVWTANTPQPSVPFPTGGTAQHNNGYLLVLAGLCVAAGLVIRFSYSTKRG